jgi:hypothetical protein
VWEGSLIGTVETVIDADAIMKMIHEGVGRFSSTGRYPGAIDELNNKQNLIQ